MFLTMFFKTQNIVQTMHLTILIAHPYPAPHRNGKGVIEGLSQSPESWDSQL